MPITIPVNQGSKSVDRLARCPNSLVKTNAGTVGSNVMKMRTSAFPISVNAAVTTAYFTARQPTVVNEDMRREFVPMDRAGTGVNLAQSVLKAKLFVRIQTVARKKVSVRWRKR